MGRNKAVARLGVPLCLISYGLLRVWYTLVVNLGVAGQYFFDATFVVNAILAVRLVTDLCIAAFASKIGTLAGRRMAAGACSVFLVLGTILLVFPGSTAGNGFVLGLAALVCGIASGVFFIMWDELFVGLETDLLQKTILWRVALEASCPLLLLLPFGVTAAICLLCPIACALGFSRAWRARPATRRLQPWHAVSIRAAMPLFWGAVLLFTGFTLIDSVPRSSVDWNVAGSMTLWTLFLGRLVALVVLIVLLRFVKDCRYEVIFRAAVLIFVSGFLVLPLPFAAASFYSSVAVQAASVIAVIGVLLVTVSVSAYATTSPLRILALGSAAVRLGNAIGLLMGSAVAFLSEAVVSEYLYFYLSSLEVMLLVVAGMFLINERTLSRFFWRPQDVSEEGDETVATANYAEAARFIGSTHGLTSREVQVLELLLEGRSVSYVSETLYISANTTKSHVKHIYQKLGVHSREELMQLSREI